MIGLLMPRIKLILFAVLSISVVAGTVTGTFWIKHLWSENTMLEQKLQTIQQEYDAIKQSCQVSVSAVEKACLDNTKAEGKIVDLRDRLKTPRISGKTALESSGEARVIPTYTQGSKNGSEGLKTRTKEDNNEERFVSLDDKLPPVVTRVLNDAFCEATSGGDSCLSSDTISN